MDGVLSYHMNPLTCGVAKFNHALAAKLQIPCLGLFDAVATCCQKPLLSIKVSEFSPEDIQTLRQMLDAAEFGKSPRLFLHEFLGSEIERQLVNAAAVVYCGNAELSNRLRSFRPDIVEAWCPGTLNDRHLFQNAGISVFAFGMAHKVQANRFRKLHRLLEGTGQPYSLYLSTALHENTSFDGSFTVAFEELKEIFGEKIYFMGYLSDTAVFNYLSEATFFAAFFDKGVRSNNTSVNVAMECGAVVITNLDEYSPSSFTHRHSVLNIDYLTELPLDAAELACLSGNARRASSQMGWDALVTELRRHEVR